MKNKPKTRYTVWDELMASPSEPMPTARRQHQLTSMYQGLRALELDAMPDKTDWRVCCDAVNLLETLIEQGHMQDPDCLITEATNALAEAAQRSAKGQRLGLTATGMQAVRSCLESYAVALESLSARVMTAAHRATERRLLDIQSGKRRAHDVRVVAI